MATEPLQPPDPEDLLRRHFGYLSFRPGQRELVEAALAAADALGVLPTGGGKSVCYQVPALVLTGLTVFVSPLVSLMADQVRRAWEAGLRAETWHSGAVGVASTVRVGAEVVYLSIKAADHAAA